MPQKTNLREPDMLLSLKEENSALKEQLRDLQNRFRMDPLTKTLSKVGFYEYFDSAARPGDALFFVDLDDFKSVNDSYGHHIGDLLLVEIGQALEHAVLPHGRVGRLAGDEFLVLMPAGKVASDLAFAEVLCSAVLGASVLVGDLPVSRSASVGSARVLEDATPEHSVINANSALRSAKSYGKNRAKAFEGKLNHVSPASPSIDEIRLGLKRHEIGYHVQPIFDLRTGRCVGYEALLRWTRRSGEVLGPAHFLDKMTSAYNHETRPPLAAAHRVAEWTTIEQGKSISFNISSAFLQQFIEIGADWIAAIIGDVPQNRVIFELVETIVDGDNSDMAQAVSRLRQKGIRIALDDFGIGHSTLHRLQSVPVDYVKVDRHFLEMAGQSERGEEIMRSIVELVHASGAQAVVEGIQDEAQLAFAKSLGAACGQGFLLGRPGPISAWEVSDPDFPVLLSYSTV